MTPEPPVVSHKKALCNILELDKYYLYDGMHDKAAKMTEFIEEAARMVNQTRIQTQITDFFARKA